jgi:dethiobiotin synthetase
VTLVIVGTGTDVGKTVVAATLLARYGSEVPLAYWKPVATGARDGRDTATVEALAGDRAAILPESYLFDEPLSPHLAARLAGERIEPAALLADFERHRAGARTLVIETAGGLLVPLAEGGGDAGDAGNAGDVAAPAGAGAGIESAGDTRGWPFRVPAGAASPASSRSLPPPLLPRRPGGSEATGFAGSGASAAGSAAAGPSAAGSGAAGFAAAASPGAGAGYLQADLIVDMARRAVLSCLVVARTGLGTINHTLLTLEALRARGLGVAGVVLDGPPNRENRRAIERFGGVETVLELPYLSPLDREEVAAAVRHFDRQGQLAPLLRPRRPVPGTETPRGQGGSRGGGRSQGGGGGGGESRGSGRGLRRGFPPA